MAKVHVIFKHNFYIEGVGGQLPTNLVHIKGSRGFYYLGEIEAANIQEITKWEPMPVPDQVASGWNLIGKTQVTENDAQENITTRDLTAQEQEDKKVAERALNKITTRSEIQGEVGDIYDLLADLSKRISLIERVTLSSLHWVYNSSSISSEIPQDLIDWYKPFLDQYKNDVVNGDLMDRVDIQDITTMYDNIKNRINTITDHVDNYLQNNYP